MSVTIRPEAEQDQAAIWKLNQAAFEGDAEAMALELVPGALVGAEGRVEFSPPFGVA